MGDQLVELTLKQAKELSDYLKDEHGIEAAAGGVIMAADGGAGDAGEAEEQTEFDVVLTSFGEKKLNIVKEVKNITGQSLMDSKKLVEGVPATIKEGVDKAEAEEIKGKLEEAGGTVELK
jgi:large subunit ribosomal protein L7/L12